MKKRHLSRAGAASIGCLLTVAITPAATAADPFSLPDVTGNHQTIVVAGSNVPKMKLTYSKIRQRSLARRHRTEMAALEIREKSKAPKKDTGQTRPAED